jgi:hypothetical protein
MTTLTCPPPQGEPERPDGGASSFGRNATLFGVGALASLFLAACGGDGDKPVTPAPPPAAATQVPTSAAANDAALEAFALNLPQTENTEPLTLDLITTLPSSESEDPIALP